MPSKVCKVCGKELTPARLQRAMKEGYKCRACAKHRRPIPGSYNAPTPPLSAPQIVQLCHLVIARANEYRRWRGILTNSLIFLPQPWTRLPYGEADKWRIPKQDVLRAIGVTLTDAVAVKRATPLFEELGLQDSDAGSFDCWKGAQLCPSAYERQHETHQTT